MEPNRPLSAVIRVVAKHGAQALSVGLVGSPVPGNAIFELLAALKQTEDRVGIQLAAIENQLNRLIGQPYNAALSTGIRILLDVDPRGSLDDRKSGLNQSRQKFMEAAGGAQDHLQGALAERYLLLTSVLLGNRYAADQALTRLDYEATHALLEASVRLNDALRAVDTSPKHLVAKAASERDAARKAFSMAAQIMAETSVLAKLCGRESRTPMETDAWEDCVVITCARASGESSEQLIGHAGLFTVNWTTLHKWKSPGDNILVIAKLTVSAARPLLVDVPVQLGLCDQNGFEVTLTSHDILTSGKRAVYLSKGIQSGGLGQALLNARHVKGPYRPVVTIGIGLRFKENLTDEAHFGDLRWLEAGGKRLPIVDSPAPPADFP